MSKAKLLEVKVWNKNEYPYEETFKGQHIKIPADSYIIMNRHEAVEFKSTFVAPKFLKQGVPDPKYFKKLVLEPLDKEKEQASAQVGPKKAIGSSDHVCNACGFEAKTEAGLKQHISKSHLQSVADPDLRKELSQEI